MRELWEVTRPYAGWVYLGTLLFPVLLGVVWWVRQVRGGGDRPWRELSCHELAYLDGGWRGVVLSAVRRLRSAGVLEVSEHGLLYTGTSRPCIADRIDRVIVANADHVYPKAFVDPLRPALRRMARRLESDGLLVERREVRRRRSTVVLVELGCCVAALAVFIVGLAVREVSGLEVLFLVCAVLLLEVTSRRARKQVLTRRGEHALVVAGVRQLPREAWRMRLRKFTAFASLLALLTRTSVATPDRDEDDPDAWAADTGDSAAWSDAFGGGDSAGPDWSGDGGGGGCGSGGCGGDGGY
jgi:uncharacterized protein (TIGR04222 family)